MKWTGSCRGEIDCNSSRRRAVRAVYVEVASAGEETPRVMVVSWKEEEGCIRGAEDWRGHVESSTKLGELGDHWKPWRVGVTEPRVAA